MVVERKIRGEKPPVKEVVVNHGIAVIGDTHVGKKNDRFAFLPEQFLQECERLSRIDNAEFVILTGDILDKSASIQDIRMVKNGLRLLKKAHKTIIFVWGNNESRLEEGEYKSLRHELEGAGAHVMQNDRLVIHDEHGEPSVAFVVASRVNSRKEHAEVRRLHANKKAEVLKNREIVNNRDLHKFKDNLAATALIPTFVIFHAPERISLYEGYKELAGDSEIAQSAKFEQALVEHQRKYRNILGGFFGHVEGGEHTILIGDSTFVNTCSKVLGKQALVAA